MIRGKQSSLLLPEPEIVKVQAPVVGAKSRWLIYARDPQNPRMQEQTPTGAMKSALGYDLKGYFEAVWNETDKYWTVGKRVGEQSW